MLQLEGTATCRLSTKDKTACVQLASPGSGDTPPSRQRATGLIQALYRIESGELLADLLLPTDALQHRQQSKMQHSTMFDIPPGKHVPDTQPLPEFSLRVPAALEFLRLAAQAGI